MTDQAAIDSPGEFRKGEELDVAALEAWLKAQDASISTPIEVQQFGKGHSNLTYFVKAGEREYVLRRPPFGTHVATAHDMRREFRVLSRLHRAYPRAPRAELFCEDKNVLGDEFYLMERIRGVILRQKVPAGITLDEPLCARLSESLVNNLAQIHAVDLKAAGLDDLGNPVGYIQRQVEGWTRRYTKSQTDEIPEVDEVTGWLASHAPKDDHGVLIHNDYKFDNVVLDPNDLAKIVGVLDWEMVTVGHPLMDVGSSLAYWTQADDPPDMQMIKFGPTHLPGMFTRQQFVDRYAELSGTNVDSIDFYYVFGLFKLSVIAQQIYWRFKHGKTSDPRFAIMIEAVKLLNRVAAQTIGASRVPSTS